jgi:nicotinamide riboside transporter PnuC
VILAEILEWYATVSGIVAALMIAADVNRKVTGWGFVLFCTMNLAWIGFGMIDETGGLTTQNVVLLAINLLGIYRYLIRRQPLHPQGAAA